MEGEIARPKWVWLYMWPVGVSGLIHGGVCTYMVGEEQWLASEGFDWAYLDHYDDTGGSVSFRRWRVKEALIVMTVGHGRRDMTGGREWAYPQWRLLS